MRKFNVYYETTTDCGNLIIEAKDEDTARYEALEELEYEAEYVQVVAELES